MTDIIHKNPGKLLNLKVQRDSKNFLLAVTPEIKKVQDIFGEGKEVGLIGIKPSGSTFIRQAGIISAATDSIERTWDISVLTIVSIAKLIQRVIPMDSIGGPVLIVQMAGEQASRGVLNFFVFMAIININLGVLNLLPIPVLDGGHLLFLGIEAIRRKPLSEKIISVSQKIGLTVLLTLMAVVIFNDVMRLISGKQFP
jgi:regulator of sigma E protease